MQVEHKAADGDELNKSTNDELNDSPIDILRIDSLNDSSSTEPNRPKSSPTKLSDDPIEPFSISRETVDDLQDSMSNDSTLCDESSDLVIDSRFFDVSNEVSIEKQNGADTSFGNLKRKFNSIDPDDVNGSHVLPLSKYHPTKEHHLDHLRQVAKASQINDQVKKVMGDGSPYSDQPSENSVFSLNSSQFNGNKNEFSFQDHLNRSAANDANNNRVRSYKPEFLKKKTNLLDQVVITDVTANNTTITVRESKSLKFFFNNKDSKKTGTNGGQLQI